MQYRRKIPPADTVLSDRLLSDGWKKIKEPNNVIKTIVLSIPLMILNGILVILLVSPIRSWIFDFGNYILNGGNLMFTVRLIYLPIFFIFLITHELLHAVLVPNFIKSKKTYWGITPFGGFVYTTEEMSKSRLLLICILPFFALSLIMPIALNLIGLFSGFVVFLALSNAMSSSVDVLNILLIGFQVPNGSRIINNGFETYHK